MKPISILFVFVGVLFSQVGSAQDVEATGSDMGTIGGGSGGSGDSAKSGTTMSTEKKLDLADKALGSAQGVNQAGNNTATKQMVSGTMNMAVGGVMLLRGGKDLATGLAPCGTTQCDWFHIALGTLELIIGTAEVGMGATQMGASRASRNTANAADFSAPGYEGNPYQVELPDGTTTSLEGLANNANSQIAKANAAGVKIDPKTGKVTLPNGKTVDGSALNSAGAVAAAFGISEAQAKKALDEANSRNGSALAKYGDLSKYKLSFAGGGGGSVDGGRSSSGGSGFDLNGLLGGARKPAQAKVAGLQKVVGGATVGVATDNIFDMVKRRYNAKKNEAFFAQ